MESLKEINNRCKIFTTKSNTQVLVTKDFDSDEDKYLIRIEARFEIDGALITPSINYNYNNEGKRDENFNKIHQEIIDKSYNALLKEVQELVNN